MRLPRVPQKNSPDLVIATDQNELSGLEIDQQVKPSVLARGASQGGVEDLVPRIEPCGFGQTRLDLRRQTREDDSLHHMSLFITSAFGVLDRLLLDPRRASRARYARYPAELRRSNSPNAVRHARNNDENVSKASFFSLIDPSPAVWR